MQYLIRFLGVCIIGIVAALLLLVVSPPAGWITRSVIEQVKGHTGITIEIGSAKVRLLPRPFVNLNSVTVPSLNPANKTPLARIAEVNLQLGLWPLLRGASAIEAVAVISPQIVIDRNDAEGVNWSSGNRQLDAMPASVVGLPVGLSVQINDGILTYTGSASPQQLRLTGLRAELQKKSNAEPLVGFGGFAWNGESFDFRAEMHKPEQFLANGRSDLGVRIEGEAAVARFNGQLTGGASPSLAGKARVELKSLPRLFAAANARALTSTALRNFLVEGELTSLGPDFAFRKAAINLDGVPGTGDITLSFRGKTVALLGRINLPELKLDPNLALISAPRPDAPATGVPSADKAPGKPDDGRLELSHAALDGPSLNVSSAKNALRTYISSLIPGDDSQGMFSRIQHWSAGSGAANDGANKIEQVVQPGTVARPGNEPDLSFDLRPLRAMKLDLHISAESFAAGELALNDASLHLLLNDGRLELTVPTARLASVAAAGAKPGTGASDEGEGNAAAEPVNSIQRGGLSGRLSLAEIDNGRGQVEATINLSSAPARPITQLLTGFGWVSGAADLKLQVHGTGATFDEIIASLSGEGRVAISHGAFHGYDFRQSLETFTVPQFDDRMSTKLYRAGASIEISNGTITSHNVRVVGDTVALSAAGSVELPAKHVDFRGRLKLLAKTSKGVPDNPSLPLTIPFQISGHWDNVQTVYDWGTLLKTPQLLDNVLGVLKRGGRIDDEFAAMLDWLLSTPANMTGLNPGAREVVERVRNVQPIP